MLDSLVRLRTRLWPLLAGAIAGGALVLLAGHGPFWWTVGVALVGVGIVSLLLVAVSHFRAVRLLARGETPALAGAQLSIATAVLVALMCTYALWVFTS